MGKEFKILSIDGGGIKGLYSACVINQIEEKYNCQMADYFDMICGTSTGGLIALALSTKRKAEEVADFYAEKGNQIFPYNSQLARFYGFLKQTFWGGKYSDKTLKKVIEEFIGANTIMNDASTLLCIPSFNLTHGQPIVFKYPHKEGGFTRDGSLKMVDVALATSAAPTYFPIAELDYPQIKGLFVDGGVWSNNPTLCGLLEALTYFVGDDKEFSSYSILSISSITSSSGRRMEINKHKSFLGWRDKLFQTPLDGQNFFADFFTEKMVNHTTAKGTYMRIPSPIQLSKEHIKDIELDKAGKASIKVLQSLGNQQGIDFTTKKEHKSKLDLFFKEKKHYSIT
jgi:patatin-like phospholipase/acyl hydrolase